MPTVEDVARAALRDVGVDVGILNAEAWVQERYEELTARRMKHLERRASLRIPAVITAGTVTATSGSADVVGNATALAAWSPTLVGRYFQLVTGDTTWYRIVRLNYSGATLVSLELDQPYNSTTSAGATYRIVQRYATLPDDVQFFSRYATFGRRRIPIYVGGMPELEILQPDRLYRTSGPEYLADAGVDEVSGQRRVEIYPYSTQAEIIEFRYWAKAKKYAPTESLPDFITTVDLKAGVMVDVYRWMMSEALRMKDKDGAAHWGNMSRSQETIWRGRHLPELIKRDQAIEDLTLDIKAGPSRFRDVRNARDEVFTRGRRP